jgi:hypothetical protein
VAHLTGSAAGGLNAPYFLNASTVNDDDRRDRLEGASGGSGASPLRPRYRRL